MEVVWQQELLAVALPPVKKEAPKGWGLLRLNQMHMGRKAARSKEELEEAGARLWAQVGYLRPELRAANPKIGTTEARLAATVQETMPIRDARAAQGRQSGQPHVLPLLLSLPPPLLLLLLLLLHTPQRAQ